MTKIVPVIILSLFLIPITLGAIYIVRTATLHEAILWTFYLALGASTVGVLFAVTWATLNEKEK